ncbi:malignant fibrous histiocytoma-amplified sequence 1 [Callorhinchus milii]|nr:malignant fibrous histiocytoma-amplified sequence 1 [Callorhinchus milii]
MAQRSNQSQPGGPRSEKDADLSKRRLKVIPPSILQRVEIENLNLDRNKLKSINDISKLQNLKSLILSKNELTTFPQEIASLPALEKLYLNQNSIAQVDEGIFTCLPLLKLLRLSNNRLMDLPSDLSTCRELQYINLSHNLLQKIPEAVLKLNKLEEFYVENNKLRELPAALFENEGLRKFNASKNRLRAPPDEVCAGGLRHIRSYFKQLMTGANREDKRIKTMFLGTSMAGKSTLSRSLSAREVVEVSEGDRTVGIEINEFEIEDFSFLCWDFAGQHEYYLTHHVFITRQALVILVIDLHKYEVGNKCVFKELVGFWVNNIFMRVPDSVVLPVGTHVDLCDEEEMRTKKKDIEVKIREMLTERQENLEQRLEKINKKSHCEFYSDQANKLQELAKYNLQVLDLIPIDCTQYTDINNVRKQILQSVRNEDIFPNAVRMLPSTYTAVEKAIAQLVQQQEIPEHGILSYEELKDKLSNFNEEHLEHILSYLHRIGLILWYQDIKALKSTLFIKPAFLITLFKMIVRHDLLDQLQSIPSKVLKKHWANVPDKNKWVFDFRTKATLHDKAIAMLVKFEVLGNASLQEIANEMIGDETEKGKLFDILENFDICLPSKSISLNPDAKEFKPGSPWNQLNNTRSLTYLFPSYLSDTKEVDAKWGEDSEEDLRVQIFFLPEIPQGFFHRVIIKLCDFIQSHWVGKERCLVVCSGWKLLLKEHNEEANSYIEIRCKAKEGEQNDFSDRWCRITMAIHFIKKVVDQWPGLHYCLKTPCRNPGCDNHFDWPDLDEKDEDIELGAEDNIKTCDKCGTDFRTELLFCTGKAKGTSNNHLKVAELKVPNKVEGCGVLVIGDATVNITKQEFND